MTSTTKRTSYYVALDATLVALACLIPAASHLVALPLYWLNPMLALLLAGMVVGRNRNNAIVLAILLPAVSCLLTGMPTAGKMVCMMAELSTIALLAEPLSKRLHILPATLLAIVCGKVVYYLLKALLIAPVALVDTNWKTQLLAALLWAGAYAWLYKRKP